MIVCSRCGKENQEHYKFCLGCGAELPRAAKPAAGRAAPAAEAAAPSVAPAADAARFDRNMQFAATQQGDVALASGAAARAATPAAPTGSTRAAMPAVGGGQPATAAGLAGPPIAAPLPNPGPVSPVSRAPQAGPPVHRCPACSNPVPADFKFCGTCGHRIGPGGAAATAGPSPSPAAPAAAAPAPVAAQPAAPQPAAAASSAQRGKLVLINPDGTEGTSFPLSDGNNPVGRNSGRVFSGDAYLSPVHATFILKGDACTVRDEQSLNGVYVKLARDRPARLAHNDVFRIGQEIMRYEAIPDAEQVDGVEVMGSLNPGFLGRVCLVIGRESIGHAHTIAPDGIYLGRERGDVIFPEDGYVSGLHCRIHRDGNAVALTDIGSSNGTFLRVRGERKLVSGELVLMGQQLFRLQFA